MSFLEGEPFMDMNSMTQKSQEAILDGFLGLLGHTVHIHERFSF